MSTRDEFLSDSEVIEDFQKIQSQSKYLTDFCRENSIPLFTGSLSDLSESYSLVQLATIENFIDPFSEVTNRVDHWDYLVSRLKHFKPSFIVLESITRHPVLEETYGYYVWRNIFKMPLDYFVLKSVIDLHDRVKTNSIGIKLFAFFSDGKICITHRLGGTLAQMLQKYEKTEGDLEREAEEEDKVYLEEEEAEDLEYQKERQERDEKIELLARELSKERKLILTKNADQRAAVTREFFGKRISGMDSWDIETLAKKAIDIFDFDELPSLVSTLKNQGKTPKQISDELGIGLAKIKKIFAIAPTESTPHPDRDFLQSMIDGKDKDNGLSNSQSHDVFQMIRNRAEAENDTETLELFRKVAKMLFEGEI